MSVTIDLTGNVRIVHQIARHIYEIIQVLASRLYLGESE
jgi:hypothetical protein